jgi:hypothetical protein
MNGPASAPAVNFQQLIEQVQAIFIGQDVAITHERNSSLKDSVGKCVEVVTTNRALGHVDFVLANRHLTGLCLQHLDPQSKTCSGNLGTYTAGTRTISVVS